MTAAARQGQVVQVHCEDGQLIDGLAAAAIAAGRTGAGRVRGDPPARRPRQRRWPWC